MAPEQTINVLLVDDEKKACTNLKNIIAEYIDPGIQIVGMAYSTIEAEEQIQAHKPHAIFLDIEMPNENAFQFLERISPFPFEVIFVTAYDEYALRAFKLNALDYILKPISIEELKNAIQRLRDKVRYNDIIRTEKISYIDIAEQVSNKVKQNRIILKDSANTELVDFKDIYYVEAQSSYSRIVFLKNGAVKEMTMSSPLSDYEDLLPDNVFYRIHRSYLINCAHIKQILNDEANHVSVGGQFTLPVSRRRYISLLEFLKNNDL